MTKNEKRLRKLQDAVWKEHEKKHTAEAKKLIGKCFKFRNSYSCPEGDKDKWWFYRRVIGVADGCTITIEHEVDKDGNLFIREGKQSPQFFDSDSGYIPITVDEYYEAFRLAVARGRDLMSKAMEIC